MDPNLKFWDTLARTLRPRATINSIGRIGFNPDAATLMELESAPSFFVATNDDDKEDATLFLIEASGKVDPGTPPAKVSRGGSYYYLNIRNVLEHLDVDYRTHRSVYDIEVSSYSECRMYVLSRRSIIQRFKRTKNYDEKQK